MHNPCKMVSLSPPESDGFQNRANLLRIFSKCAGLGKRTHLSLMNMATGAAPPLSQIATDEYPLGDRISEREG